MARFPYVNEPRQAKELGKPLFIVAATGWLMREQNPHIPYTPREIADQIIAAYKEGAAAWHIHIREPKTGRLTLPMDDYAAVLKETADMVFKECPDIVMDPNILWSGRPPRLLPDGRVDPESLKAEYRRDPCVEEMLRMGNGTPRYVETGVINVRIGNFMTAQSLREEAAWLESKGIKPELGMYNVVSLQDTIDNVIEPGVISKPYFIAIGGAVHDSTPITPWKVAMLNMMALVEMLPEGTCSMWIGGGRNYLPSTVQAILMGVDGVRVGMEEGVYRFPHKDDLITGVGEQVRQIATIAKELGREIATPNQMRQMLGLKPLAVHK